MQQKENDGITKASPNGKETKNKDKFKMPKCVESVTSEVIVERKPTWIHW